MDQSKRTVKQPMETKPLNFIGIGINGRGICTRKDGNRCRNK